MPKHSETRKLPYSAQQMYDLVADVASYPKFLPWTAAARIRSRTQHEDHEIMLADLVVSFKVFRESFGSRVVLWRDVKEIDTSYIDGPFHHLESTWQFMDCAGGCEVFFSVDFCGTDEGLFSGENVVFALLELRGPSDQTGL